jgi:hypothetical protein
MEAEQKNKALGGVQIDLILTSPLHRVETTKCATK